MVEKEKSLKALPAKAIQNETALNMLKARLLGLTYEAFVKRMAELRYQAKELQNGKYAR